MKVCFPVIANEGLESTIYGHFASAPRFVIVDTGSEETYDIVNCDLKKPYAGSSPFLALRGRQLDGIVVDGIGDDALQTMHLCGFRVYQAQSASVRENVELFERQELPELEVQNSHLEGTCPDQEEGRSCGHCH